MPDSQTFLDLVLQPEIALPILLAGMLLSFYVGRRTSDSTAQVDELEGALEDLRGERSKAQEQLGDYQTKVSNHFTETSEKLHELTLQYRAVYDHLAAGATELCPDTLQKLEGGLGLDALPEESSPRGEDELEPELETDLDDVPEPVREEPAPAATAEPGQRATDEPAQEATAETAQTSEDESAPATAAS